VACIKPGTRTIPKIMSFLRFFRPRPLETPVQKLPEHLCRSQSCRLRQIAEEAVDKMDPHLSRAIAADATSHHPEIANGRRTLIDARERRTGIVLEALKKAVSEQ